MIGMVTGASRGLGLELIKIGLDKGYQMVAGVYNLIKEDNKELFKLKDKFKNSLLIIKMDVSVSDEVKEASFKLSEKYKHLDFIVNNAGVLFESKFDTYDPMKEIDIDMALKTININTVGPMRVLKYFADFIYNAKEPTIINISSEAAHLVPGGYRYLTYSVSKHGLNMYSQQIRNYFQDSKDKDKIRLFMVHPGRMQTVMGKENAQISPKKSAEGIMKIINKDIDPKLNIPFVDYKGNQMPY